MDKSITETLKKINIELKGSGFLSIILSLTFIISFINFKSFKAYKAAPNKAFSYMPSKISKEAFRSESKQYIYASKRGTKYYYFNCKSTIKEENKIFFESEEMAERAGYSLAKACQ